MKAFEQVEKDRDKIATNDYTEVTVKKGQSEYRKKKVGEGMKSIGVTEDKGDVQGVTEVMVQVSVLLRTKSVESVASQETSRPSVKQNKRKV